mmetsp:Transcript_12805/g.30055  ORF Transcript_12805/g.30055 Transcript_12805/m.30055 type:complete len:138 (+) Transcript_12805:148-561(+)
MALGAGTAAGSLDGVAAVRRKVALGRKTAAPARTTSMPNLCCERTSFAMAARPPIDVVVESPWWQAAGQDQSGLTRLFVAGGSSGTSSLGLFVAASATLVHKAEAASSSSGAASSIGVELPTVGMELPTAGTGSPTA